MSAIIQTHHGIMINLLHPDPFAMNINDIGHALAHLCRFNGHVREFYSVAQHSLLVSLNVPAEDAFVGLMHDATEAYCGDMVGPLKAALPGYQDIECGIWEALAYRYKLPVELPASVREADLRLLAAEHRDLHDIPMQWDCLEGVVPIVKHIYPMSATASRATFIKQFHHLKEMRNVRNKI